MCNLTNMHSLVIFKSNEFFNFDYKKSTSIAMWIPTKHKLLIKRYTESIDTFIKAFDPNENKMHSINFSLLFKIIQEILNLSYCTQPF